MSIETRNPATGELIKVYPALTQGDVDIVLEQVHNAFLQWRQISIQERAELMENTALVIESHKEDYAGLMADEMGKPITAGLAELVKCQKACRYYAENAQYQLADRHISTEMKKSYVTYQPLGTVFGIMPWNFPFWQVFRFAVPNLIAGNTCVLSHAPISTGTGQVIESILKKAGFPDSVFRSVVVENDMAKYIIEHEHICGVILTGSELAGRTVGAEAGHALKKIVLELGGVDPYVILEDADLELAAESIVRSRMLNTGQVCIAAKRIIAVTSVCEKLQQLVLAKLSEYKLGNPRDEGNHLGPLAREDLRAQVHKQVLENVAAGATLLEGGQMPEGDGYYYPPTVLTGLTANMPANSEEIFGPVICFFEVADEAEAIHLANDTNYGLSGAVFTRNDIRGEMLARQKINAGACFVNSFVASDPRLPFGGIKDSGYGRELSDEGIRAFVNVKTISIA